MLNNIIKKDIENAKECTNVLISHKTVDETTAILMEVADIDESDIKYVLKEVGKKK